MLEQTLLKSKRTKLTEISDIFQIGVPLFARRLSPIISGTYGELPFAPRRGYGITLGNSLDVSSCHLFMVLPLLVCVLKV